jgi:hypothetical protein
MGIFDRWRRPGQPPSAQKLIEQRIAELVNLHAPQDALGLQEARDVAREVIVYGCIEANNALALGHNHTLPTLADFDRWAPVGTVMALVEPVDKWPNAWASKPR